MAKFKATKKEHLTDETGEVRELTTKDFKDMKPAKDFQMSQLEGIRRGQAFNLAVQAVITKAGTLGAKDEEDFNTRLTDKKEIFSLFTFYYELGKLSQTYSMDEIKSIIE